MKEKRGETIIVFLVLCCILSLSLSSAQIVNYQFNQTLDHFNSSDDREFSQRYQIYSNFYKKGGPIILIVGPEREIYPAVEIYLSSVFSYFAPSLHAFIIATEHRYYGESLPFGSSSFYLDSLNSYSSLFSLSPTPIITVGGSYGGYLSALLRILYPDLVLGSIASCTVPYLWGLPNQGDLWLSLVSESFYLWPNNSCYTTLDKEFSALVEAVEQGDTEIQNSLLLCENPTLSTYSKLSLFIESAITNIVEFNYPKPEVFCVSRPFDHLCSFIQNNSSLSDNQYPGILEALQLYYNQSGTTKCFEWLSSTPSLPSGCKQQNKNKNLLTEAMYGAWQYQSCTEFIYGAYGGQGFFHYGNNWTMDITRYSCQEIIPNSVFAPYPPLIEAGEAPSFTNVIFSRAEFDPNRGWSITEDLSDTVVEVLIETEAHTSDICNFGQDTSPSLFSAMSSELNHIQKWIANFQQA